MTRASPGPGGAAPRSFRAQLATRATAVVALGLVALSAVTLVTLKAVLDAELEAAILNVASIQAASLTDSPDGRMHFHEWELTPDEASSVRDLIQYAQVWSADGVSLLRSRYMTSDLPVDPEALRQVSQGEVVWAEQRFEGASVRTLFYPLERMGEAHEAHVLQVAAPLARRNDMLWRAGLFLALLTAALAAVTFAGSWWLAGSAVGPIHEVIDQAEEIGAGSLDRRIQAYADTSEYRRLVDVLNTMLARLQGSFEAQRRFAADASHELRSPLTAMRGEIELALRRERSPEEYLRVLDSTLEEVVRLSTITEDLLTLARSDSGAVAPRREPTDIVAIASGVAERLRGRADAKALTLDVHADGPVNAVVDPGLIGQALWNLMENAIKFTPRGGSVRISVRPDGDDVEITVSDTGPGLGDIDPADVFRRFYRSDPVRSRGSDTAGTGLGLAIVKAVVDAHEGTVVAGERPGGGARFVVRLPSSPHRGGGAA